MNMKRLSLVFVVLLLAFTQHVHAQYYSVNYDARTVAAMAAAFGTEVVAESYYREQVDDILKHYTAAEVAAAGIFSSKFLEHKALSDLGIWCSSTENYYYRRIYHMVADKIIPKIWVVAKQMLHSPQTAIHWGSYLMKVCDETKSLCMQFESVVTNSTLSFSDIAFLEINSEVVPLLKLSELGGIDWQRMLDDFSRIPDRFTRENLQSDLDNLYNLGVGLATAGASNLGDALLPESMFHNLLSGKVSEIANLYDHYSGLFEEAEQGIGNLLLDKIGGPDNVAGLFEFGDYDLAGWISDYIDDEAGTYYTQRWYIARRDQGSVSLCDYYPPTDAVSGPVSKRATLVFIPMPRSGNRLSPTRNDMPDGRETVYSSSTTRMTATLTASTTGRTPTSSAAAASRQRRLTPTRYMSRKAGTMRKSCMKRYSIPTLWIWRPSRRSSMPVCRNSTRTRTAMSIT